MDWISPLLDNLTYQVIFLLMLLESTVVPVPSELVIAPAAYHAANGDQNIFLIIAVSTLGADCGATVNYLAGYFLGRPIIYRFADSRLGRLCLLDRQKVEKAELYFNNNVMVATITGRLIVGIRHLISIPAGLAKMNYYRFLLYTTIGATAWHAILAVLGLALHAAVPEERLAGTIERYGHIITFSIIAVITVIVLVIVVKRISKRPQPSEDRAEEAERG